MSDDSDDPVEVYRVVLNHEEQYSIWPADRDLPPGWRDEGTVGPKADCLAHIDQVWTDMRPLSLRQYMERMANEPVTEEAEPLDDEEPLVDRLSRGDHPVEVVIRPERTGPALREAIERGYVFIRFTNTRGGTELGVRIDATASSVDGADFDTATGPVHLAGDLTLDFVPVRCIADVDLATMSGTGRLVVGEPAA
ncbi:MbtH domain-containing protein [Micromonospora craterilacus]|uniref:MbtH domain-containing protein n=1 Tax=Micromonospora craterilacus TaxID=1655439 RepID=A0A2W2FCL4_9ACTN|nr:MbtH domain-containing protein [Micromonospora craterilacus]